MMLTVSTNKWMTAIIHVMVWTVFALAVFFRHPILSGNEISMQLWVIQIVTLVLLMAAFYVNTTFLVPRLLLKNNTVYYFLTVLCIVIIVMIVNVWVEMALPRPAPAFMERKFVPGPLPPKRGWPVNTLNLVITALVLVIGTSITVIDKWQKDKEQRKELEKEKANSELSLLKAQINPHFFFNTLNNIYALTQVDAVAAGKAVHQLSRMMRYLLYDTQQDQTLLSQEIAFVQNFIYLMRLRLTDAIEVIFETPASLEDKKIAPMILLPFVENAFKHGVSAVEKSRIDIQFIQHLGRFDMMVTNSLLKEKNVSVEIGNGIGLTNTRRRLDLLYSNKYQLHICERTVNNEYTVHLMLDLT